MVQSLGSGPQSMDKFYSHKAHKQQAMVPKAEKDMWILLARDGLIEDFSQSSCFTDPKLSQDHPWEMLL